MNGHMRSSSSLCHSFTGANHWSSLNCRNADNGHELAWLEARYVCLSGYELEGSGTPLLCRNREWIGPVPSCAPALHVQVEAVRMREVNESLCPSSHGLCEQLCSVNRETGQHECSCFRGFAMQEDGRCGGECTGCGVGDELMGHHPSTRYRRVQRGSVPVRDLYQHKGIVPLLLPQGISTGRQPLCRWVCLGCSVCASTNPTVPPCRRQRVLVAQQPRTVPGRLYQYTGIVRVQLRGSAWNGAGWRWTTVRVRGRLRKGQRRMFAHVSLCQW